MKIYPDTTIYIVCPANYRSGGPESLHQLCSQLIQFGVNAKMIYSFGSSKMNTADPVDEAYKKYHVPWCLPDNLSKIDLPKNILVNNESSATSPYVMKKIRIIFWWLSVNNFFEDIMTRLRNHLLNPLAAPVPKFFYFDKADKNIEHWSKSEYSRQFLKMNGINADKIHHVETYMNQIFFKQASKINLAEKENIVVYNPKKGFEITQKLMAAAPDIAWRPIKNMTSAQVQELLGKAKIYMDFGEHPGRDRLPREATISGCVVITGRRGAAGNDVDINIPAEFKFDEQVTETEAVIKKIREVFDNFEEALNKQKDFCQRVYDDKKNFAGEVAAAFGIKNFPPPSVAFVQGFGEKSFLLATELFRGKDFVPSFIIDDVMASTKISDKIILREQNRNYLRVGENVIEIITRDDAKFLYWEGRIKKFALLEPDDSEFDEFKNFYEPADEDVLIFER